MKEKRKNNSKKKMIKNSKKRKISKGEEKGRNKSIIESIRDYFSERIFFI